MVQTRSQTNISRKVYVNENDEMEAKVWKLRNEMVGMKNVNIEKKEKIIKKTFSFLSGELETVKKVEVAMDLIKYQWKFVLKGLVKLSDFMNEFDDYVCIPEWFKQDFEKLIMNFILYEKHENFNKVLMELTFLQNNPKTKIEYIQLIKYALEKNEQYKGNSKQRIFWGLQAIEYGFNFVLAHHCKIFQFQLISKIKEFKDNDKLNEIQKARLEFLLEQTEEANVVGTEPTKQTYSQAVQKEIIS